MCLENQLAGDVARFEPCFLAVPSGNETVGVKHIKNAFKILGNQQPGLVDVDTAKYRIPWNPAGNGMLCNGQGGSQKAIRAGRCALGSDLANTHFIMTELSVMVNAYRILMSWSWGPAMHNCSVGAGCKTQLKWGMFGFAAVAFGLNLKTLVLNKTCTSCVSNVYTEKHDF